MQKNEPTLSIKITQSFPMYCSKEKRKSYNKDSLLLPGRSKINTVKCSVNVKDLVLKMYRVYSK